MWMYFCHPSTINYVLRYAWQFDGPVAEYARYKKLVALGIRREFAVNWSSL